MTKRLKITNFSIKGLDVDDRRANDTEITGFLARITPAQARYLAKAKIGEVANGVDVQEVKK